MRRVERGPRPLDDGNNPKRHHPYNEAKSDLLERIGGYCSYCERPGELHVEHVVPRHHRQDLAEEWTNFLLGCANCNGIKGHRNDSRSGYLWPDQDDTEAAFEYLPDGIVQVRPDLSERDRVQATNLFNLVGLGRRPAANPRASDLRWRKRREAWGQAVEARETLRRADDGDGVLELVVRLAAAVGFWSVWMTVFADLPRVRELLRDRFPGTR